MRVIETIADLRAALPPGEPVCLVPTMGNLHEGHLSLIRAARARIDGERSGLVVASIFVNPMQFGPQDDFVKYPRTLRRDCELLSGGGCDIVFAPGPLEIYPVAQEYRVQPPTDLADILEGAVRPGFFTGVCTVVLKLFNIVRPNAAVFGKKDYQQLLIVTNMVRQLNLPIEILAGETVREDSGLALSSRNGYLDDRQRVEAAQLQVAIAEARREAHSGRTDWPAIEQAAIEFLVERGWKPDYVAIRSRSDLRAPTAGRPMVVLGAARIGDTRLIDNLEI
ncbi:MAG: pantoate--beta-alanine ligase [Steroidobacteraceae bacterium]